MNKATAPAHGDATATINTQPLLRLIRPTTSFLKWPNELQIALGSYGTAVNSQSRADFNLIDGGSSTVDRTVLSLLVTLPLGWASVIALFGTFFLMSIMFPTIFSLGIHGVGEHTKQASSYIVMAIVGGAVTPPLMGKMADVFSMRASFLLPALCFAVIAIYGLTWKKLHARSVSA